MKKLYSFYVQTKCRVKHKIVKPKRVKNIRRTILDMLFKKEHFLMFKQYVLDYIDVDASNFKLGKTCHIEDDDYFFIVDFKSDKNLPSHFFTLLGNRKCGMVYLEDYVPDYWEIVFKNLKIDINDKSDCSPFSEEELHKWFQ